MELFFQIMRHPAKISSILPILPSSSPWLHPTIHEVTYTKYTEYFEIRIFVDIMKFRSKQSQDHMRIVSDDNSAFTNSHNVACMIELTIVRIRGIKLYSYLHIMYTPLHYSSSDIIHRSRTQDIPDSFRNWKYQGRSQACSSFSIKLLIPLQYSRDSCKTGHFISVNFTSHFENTLNKVFGHSLDNYFLPMTF